MRQTDYSDFICPIKFCSGALALETLPAELRVYNARKPLILFSNQAVAKGLIDPVQHAFNDSEMVCGIYDGVPEQPTLSTIQEISGLYRKNGHDALIAVGSGAVSTVSKVVNIAVSCDSPDLKKRQGDDQIHGPLRPFFAVPEASETGLATNGFARIDSLSFSSRHLIPDYLAIDPRMVQETSAEVIADSAMRAFSVASFAYALPESDYFVDPHAYLAIQTISENLVPVLTHMNDKKQLKDYLVMNDTEKGRLALTMAACLGGFLSFARPVGVANRLGEALSGALSQPSGILAGLLLPLALKVEKTLKGRRPEKLLLAIAGSDIYARTPASERGERALSLIRDLTESLFHLTHGAIPRTLSSLGLSKEMGVDAVSRMTADDPELDPKAAREILDLALSKEDR